MSKRRSDSVASDDAGQHTLTNSSTVIWDTMAFAFAKAAPQAFPPLAGAETSKSEHERWSSKGKDTYAQAIQCCCRYQLNHDGPGRACRWNARMSRQERLVPRKGSREWALLEAWALKLDEKVGPFIFLIQNFSSYDPCLGKTSSRYLVKKPCQVEHWAVICASDSRKLAGIWMKLSL